MRDSECQHRHEIAVRAEREDPVRSGEATWLDRMPLHAVHAVLGIAFYFVGA